jgi:hypothetical protein
VSMVDSSQVNAVVIEGSQQLRNLRGNVAP